MSRKTVVIVGTGDYGRALAKRLLKNYNVVCGSRNPEKRNLAEIDVNLRDATLATIEDSLALDCEAVFLAINATVYPSLAKYVNLLAGKVVVEVSNLSKKPKPNTVSNAEVLAEQLSGARVVKAFNTVSAYTLDSDNAGDSRNVYVCGDDESARKTVMDLARNMGFTPVDSGALMSARQLEVIPHTLFQGWGVATVIMLVGLVLWFLYAMTFYYWRPDSPRRFYWDRLASNMMNKVFGCLSVTLLGLCYLPGCLAAFLQIINGTKYKRFPNWLDTWLKSRKGLGLYALLYAVMHMILSVALLNEGYFGFWYKFRSQTITHNATRDYNITISSQMNWMGELCVLLGVLALVTMGIVGITSLPSVGASMNWREFRFVQSYLGWVCFILAIAHVTAKSCERWNGHNFEFIVQTLAFISMIIPWFALLLKLILVIPCVNIYLWKIRGGYERGQENTDVEVGKPEHAETSQSRSSLQSNQVQPPEPNGSANHAYELTERM